MIKSKIKRGNCAEGLFSLLILILLLIFLSIFTVRVCGQGAAVQVSAGSWGANVVTNRSITILPIALWSADGTLPAYDPVTKVTDSTGSFWLSNVVSGTYQATLHGPPSTTIHFFYVDPTNTVQFAASNGVASTRATWPPDSVAWSAAASDLRYAFKGAAGVGNPNALTNFDTRSWTNLAMTSLAGGVLLIDPAGVVTVHGASGASQMGDLLLSGIFQVYSNSLSAWPTAPAANGAAALVNSNGFPYLLLSTNGGGGGAATWTATNKIGW